MRARTSRGAGMPGTSVISMWLQHDRQLGALRQHRRLSGELVRSPFVVLVEERDQLALRAADRPALRAAATPRWGSRSTRTPGRAAAISALRSGEPSSTTIVSMRG